MTATDRSGVPARQTWTGRIISGFFALFLLFDGGIKVLALPPAVAGTTSLGYPASAVRGIGVLELACLALYLIPRTSALGAVLLTAYLGGATATHVRAGSGLFPILFPALVGAMLWAGLLLRDEPLRRILPVRRSSNPS